MGYQVVPPPAVCICQVPMYFVGVSSGGRFNKKVGRLLFFLDLNCLLSQMVQVFVLDVVTLSEHIHYLGAHDVMSFEGLSHYWYDRPFVDYIL